jgi:hypothetical protein
MMRRGPGITIPRDNGRLDGRQREQAQRTSRLKVADSSFNVQPHAHGNHDERDREYTPQHKV